MCAIISRKPYQRESSRRFAFFPSVSTETHSHAGHKTQITSESQNRQKLHLKRSRRQGSNISAAATLSGVTVSFIFQPYVCANVRHTLGNSGNVWRKRFSAELETIAGMSKRHSGWRQSGRITVAPSPQRLRFGYLAGAFDCALLDEDGPKMPKTSSHPQFLSLKKEANLNFVHFSNTFLFF